MDNNGIFVKKEVIDLFLKEFGRDYQNKLFASADGGIEARISYAKLDGKVKVWETVFEQIQLGKYMHAIELNLIQDILSKG